ncbi:MAG: hypothetical protein WCO13_04450 [Bacteroidota bacterium]
MTNKFITAMRANKNWLTISFFLIAFIIKTISFFHGGVGAMNPTLFFIGLIILFFALLNTWGNRGRKYYLILMGVSVLLFFFFFKFGMDPLVKTLSQYQFQGHWVEDMAWSIGFILFDGFMAGLIGFFYCIAKWR